MGNRPGLVRWGPGPTALPGAPRKARTGTTLRPFIPSNSETRDALYLQTDPFLIGLCRGDLSSPHIRTYRRVGRSLTPTVHGRQSGLVASSPPRPRETITFLAALRPDELAAQVESASGPVLDEVVRRHDGRVGEEFADVPRDDPPSPRVHPPQSKEQLQQGLIGDITSRPESPRRRWPWSRSRSRQVTCSH